MKSIFKRIGMSFAISSLCGLLFNLIFDLIVSIVGNGVIVSSMAPEFVALFPSSSVAAYVNVLLYGAIGATFSGMAFIYELDRLGFVIQNILYFLTTSVVLVVITMLIWQLQKYPQALICTWIGYGVTYLIMGTIQYRALKKDIGEINNLVNE